ncbi:hypothetical protein FJTKL_00430 [Diaporthe vaccinii]|uniref:Uncharacterized protein n=1 Tax=Diaporthe vaccinii TaxID=105482 RepID=A0ABR4E2X5_9PEZI
MVYTDGSYYMTHTSDTHIEMSKAKTLDALVFGETKTIWEDTNATRSAHMWAPEIHQIDDTWYMLYSSCHANVTCCDTCMTRILRGCDGSNPYDCDYEFLADLVPPPGRRGGPEKNLTFSIDGTYLEVPNHGRYHVVSAMDENNNQSIQITKLDTDSWTVEGWNIISQPDQPWERNLTNFQGNVTGIPFALNEGPHPLYYQDQVWLTYSGSFCGTPNYALGLLQYLGGDPLDRSSWLKTGPVLTQANGNFGTGHNCFFSSPDGTEIWNAFHATVNPAGSCGDDRFTMAQKIEFKGNNTPSFGIPQPLSEMLVPPSGE